MDGSTFWPTVLSGVTVAFFAALLAAVLGPWIASRWNFYLKQRELDLAAVEQFFMLYGEFYAVWKLWQSALDAAKKGLRQVPDEIRSELLRRASDAEGNYQALLAKMCIERRLEAPDFEILARFREAQQCLRESIEIGTELRTKNSADDMRWRASQVGPGWGVAYAGFKTLSVRVGAIVTERRRVSWHHRAVTPATIALEQSTLRAFADSWWAGIPAE
ncbi:MAG: hypothetical protein ABI563_17025 [Specibacter sp.]